MIENAAISDNRTEVYIMDRFTTRTKSGRVMLNRDMFPEYADETLQRELSAFEPFVQVVERLCQYEDAQQ